MTRIECVLEDEGEDAMISSRAGLNSTCPNVNHLLTVIDPTRRLTWLIGDSSLLSLSCSGMLIIAFADIDRECELVFESRFGGELLLELRSRGLRADDPGVEELRSPYPAKKSVKLIGVVGVLTVVKRSFIRAAMSAL